MYPTLWALYRPYRFALTLALFLQSIAGISSLIPWIAVSQIASSPVHHYYDWAFVALLGGMTWLSCQTLSLYLTHQTDNQICYQLRLQLLDKLGKLPLHQFTDQGKNGIQQIIDRDVRLLHQLTAHAPADMTKLIIVPTVATLILLWQNWLLMLFCLIPLLAATYVFKLMASSRYQQQYDARNKTLSHLYAQYSELADAPQLARQFPDKLIQKSTIDALNAFQCAFNRWIAKIGALGSLTQLGTSAALLSLWVILGAQLMPEPVSLSQVILFILLIHSIASPVAAIGHGRDALNLAVGASFRITRLLNQPEMQYGEKSLEGACCDLNVNQASYVYQGMPLLSNISLSIPHGQLVAIVGQSGAGKSTLLQLMARFLDPTQGEITLNNIALSEFSLTGLNQQITIVMQNTQPMPYSLRENLQLFAPNATINEINKYLKKLNLLSLVAQHPKGLESIIGKDINLSGGEAQRLAIARALLSPAPILLFDEPTSALDPQNAQCVLSALQEEKRTCILITHELACLDFVGQVLLLDNGELIATGTHQQLSNNNPHYQQLLSALVDIQ